MIPLRRATTRAVAALAVTTAAVALGSVPVQPAGAAWAAAGHLPSGAGRIWSVAISPGDANTAVAGTDGGVFVTHDQGATWQATPITRAQVWTVGFAAQAPNPLFAGLANGGVRRSDDGGVTWTDVSTGLGNLDVRSLAFGAVGIAAGTDDGVFVSADGRTWHDDGLRNHEVSSLAVSSNSPTFTLVAGCDGGDLNNGFLYRSTGPGTWEALQQGLPTSAVVSAVAAGPLPATVANRPLLVATNKGVYHSGDGGTNWTSSTGVPDQVALTSLRYSPVDPNLVYAGSDAGGSTGGALLRSTDAGATFSPADQGLGDAKRNVAALAVAAASPPLVMAAIDPPGGGGSVYTEVDASAPKPGAVGAEGKLGAIPTLPPRPTPRATPAPGAATTAPTQPSTGLRHFAETAFGWPFPLALELFVLVLVAYVLVRWRQRHLDIEGPP